MFDAMARSQRHVVHFQSCAASAQPTRRSARPVPIKRILMAAPCRQYFAHRVFGETITRGAGLALTLNSAELPEPLHLFSETSPWDDVRRIYRRICVLRANRKTDDAAQLENRDLARALAEARIATNNSEEEAIVLAQEAERVANAAVLAELIAPMVAEQVRVESQRIAPQNIPAAAPAGPTTKAARPRPESVPTIADMLDGMLSQEPAPSPRPRNVQP